LFPSYVNEGRNSIDKMNAYAHDILSNLPSFEVLHQLYSNNVTVPIFDGIFKDNGPIFTRLFSSTPENEICPEVEETLKLTNVNI